MYICVEKGSPEGQNSLKGMKLKTSEHFQFAGLSSVPRAQNPGGWFNSAGRVYGPNCLKSAPYAAKIMKNINLSELTTKIENLKTRGAWEKGVKCYAFELVEKLEEYAEYNGTPGTIEADSPAGFLEICLNGTQDWEQYSRGGNALIYDGDIAERLCTKSELKRTKGGERRPNRLEDWIDVQSRALRQAYCRVASFAFPGE